MAPRLKTTSRRKLPHRDSLPRIAVACLLLLTGGLLACSEGTDSVVAPVPREPVQPTLTPADVEIQPAAVELVSGESHRFLATVRDSAGDILSDVSVDWSVDDTAIAHIDRDGTLQTQRSGRVIVSARIGTLSATAPVKVLGKVIAVEVTPATITLATGDTEKLRATAVHSGDERTENAAAKWSSSEPSVAQVDENGAITAIASGAARITAKIHGKTGSATVSVVPTSGADDDSTILVTSAPRDTLHALGDSVALTATVYDDEGTALSADAVTWKSLDPQTASVTGSGARAMVISVASGRSRIEADFDGQRDTLPIHVEQVVATVHLQAPSRLTVGETKSATAVVRDSNGVLIEGLDAAWSSSDPEVLAVSQSGELRAQSAGTATVVARVDGHSDSSDVRVNPVPVASVSLSPSALSVTVGDTARLDATALDSDGNQLTGRTMAWSSTDTTVATVGDGLVAAIGAGDAEVVVLVEGRADTAAVHVDDATSDGGSSSGDDGSSSGGSDSGSGSDDGSSDDGASDDGSSDDGSSDDGSSSGGSGSGAVRAFPGAAGYGAQSLGGRGGNVLFVTHTGDGGAGSLRACVEARGPRTCVFRTGGSIILDAPLFIDNPYITIAGQTAPGDGIQVRARATQSMPIFKIRTHDVVIRYVRARSGQAGNGSQQDAIGIKAGAQDVILDHVTAMYGSDEQISAKIASGDRGSVMNITVQRSLIGNVFASHPTAGLWTSARGRDHMQNISLHHNVFANAGYRTPLVGSALRVEAINNVVYNWPAKSAMANGDPHVDLINTFYRAGPATGNAANLLQVNNLQSQASIHVEGLVAEPAKPSAGSDAWNYVQDRHGNSVPLRYRRATPHSRGSQPAPVPVRVSTAKAAFQDLVSGGDVGAWRVLTCDGHWRDVRDALDRQTLSDVRNRTRAGSKSGGYPADPSGYGGYPQLSSGSPCPDADADGMPDAFESGGGLSPTDPTDAALDRDGDGYPNLEEYLNASQP